MLKVECEACKAPYQVDERRVPPTGLKMRCPKCGHSFVVQNPNAPAAPPPAAPPRPAVKQTMLGVGVPGAPAQAPPPNPAPLPIEDPFAGLASSLVAKAPDVTDLPAALGGFADADLPAVSQEVGLPALPQKKAPPAVPPKPYAMGPAAKQRSPDFQIDLPSPVADLPAARAPARPGGGLSFDVDLPAPAADLPAPRQAGMAPGVVDLPAVAAGLPAPAGTGLPAVRKGGGGFGEIDLPSLAGDLPAVPPRDYNLPAVGAGLPAVGAGLPAVGAGLPAVGAGLPVVGGAGLPMPADPLGHLPAVSGPGPNLPASITDERHMPSLGGSLPAPILDDRHLPKSRGEADFGELELPRSNPPAAMPAPQKADSRATGGVGFGEVDLSAGDNRQLATEALAPRAGAVRPSPDEAAIPTGPAKRRERLEVDTTPSRAPRIFAVLLALILLGGVALQLTPYGAFGYLAIFDVVHEGEYNKLADSSAVEARKRLAVDVYDQGIAALNELTAIHGTKPRARAITAYAALVEYEIELRFGRDSNRSARAHAWVNEVRAASPNARYLAVALAAQKAVDGQLADARKELDAASKRDVGDPVQQDIALTRGEAELAAKDPVAAVVAFTKALQLAPSARAHFGLARAYAMSGDIEKARVELGATLAASAGDAGALILRATLAWDKDRNETAASQDLTEVITGKAKDRASPADRARAYTLKGWIDFGRGRVTDARAEFDEASKLDPANVSALVGQGEALYSEGRFAEALAHFDTAVQTDPTSPQAIASDAKAKIALERLEDAKKQLTAARQSNPNDVRIAYWLGKAEEALGNKKAAEDAYLAAIGLIDPKADDAINPYLALSELLAAEGRASEAQAKLDEARAKLPESSTMDRALGEVAAVQGLYDEAVQHYQAAIAKDPQDLSSRFLLGVTYRRMQKIDLAGGEFDKVYAADKDYPGLAMERGLLFEQSGHVDEALEQFRTALAKAPDDTDLQLRVGAAYVGVGHPDDAIKMLKPVIEKRPMSAEANHYIGRAYFQKGGVELPQAMRYLRRAVELDPNRAEYHLYLAWIANESTPPDLGVVRQETDRALALDKLLADGYWQRGVLERKQGAVDDGIRDLKRALQLKPTRFEAHAGLAECYEDKNDVAAAMAEWAKAIAGDDSHPDWRYRYGRLLLEKNKAAAALPHLLFGATEAEKMDIKPGWFAQAEFLAAQALRKAGKKGDAAEHYRRFLQAAPSSSPDRKDAISALSALGQPYEGD